MLERTESTSAVALCPPRVDLLPGLGPDVFGYQDFRVFLADWLQWKKNLQPHYSGALFAKKAGFNSHTLLGMVIRGQRNLSPTSIRAFVRALSLRGKEANCFEKLVLFNQARNAEDKAYYLEQLIAVSRGEGKDGALQTWTQNYAAYLSHWYVVAIRELACVKDFVADPDWIAAKLQGRISRKQAEEAWSLLLALEMVEHDAADIGKWRIVHPVLEINAGPVDVSLQSFNKEYLELAKAAVDENESGLAGHEITTLTLGVEAKDLARLTEKVHEFRRQLNLEFSATSCPADQVIAVNVQILVLSAAAAR
jgi:uncharacterized protein (TIGR02147 family)